MAAYVVVDIDITDPAAFGEYQQLAGPIVAKYGGKLLAAGPPAATLEGNWQPKVVTILEFPSIEQAQQWHAAPEYQAPKALRQRAATCHAVLVAGVPPRIHAARAGHADQLAGLLDDQRTAVPSLLLAPPES